MIHIVCDRDSRLESQGIVNLRGVRVVTDPWHVKGDKNPKSTLGVPVYPMVEHLGAERDAKGRITHSRVHLRDVASRKTATRAMKNYMAGEYME